MPRTQPESAAPTASNYALRRRRGHCCCVPRRTSGLDLTSFVMRAALPRAESVVTAAENIQLSERDSLRVLELLENPPPPDTPAPCGWRAGA